MVAADAREPKAQFKWSKAWYPVSPVSWLERGRPNEFRVLNRPLVAWYTGKQWAVAEDLCPHRAAPLSLGYVTDAGALACRYHGWEFESSGACSRVPWATDGEQEGRICSAPASRLRLVPCEVFDGLLWVWPDESETAEAECGLTPPAAMAHAALPGEWGMVELPVGYVPALENQFDPAHAEFLHAKFNDSDSAIGATNPTQFVPMTSFRVRPGSMSEKGFVVEHGGYNTSNEDVLGERTFIAPTSSRTEYSTKDGEPYLSAHVLYTPTEPNRVKMFTKFAPYQAGIEAGRGAKAARTAATARDNEPGAPPLERLQAWARNTHRSLLTQYLAQLVGNEDVRMGLQHGFSTAAYTLGDQDIAAMHGVEYSLSAAGRRWNEGGYFLPTQADAGVGAFRRWMESRAGGAVDWLRAGDCADGIAPLLPEGERYERFHRHTKHCKYCRAALAALGDAESACRTAAAPSLALGAALSVLGLERLGALALALGGTLILEAEALADEAHEVRARARARAWFACVWRE